MNDFYVGYLANAPAALASFVRRVILALALLVIVLGLVFVFAQQPFAISMFEFGKIREFEGTINGRPYPTLLVRRPGETGLGQDLSEYLLVAPGKQGADTLIAPFDGKEVRLRGQLIYRSGRTMLEVVPGSIDANGSPATGQAEIRDIGSLTVTGEIVDSKCYLGVMNPGNGKVHRDCASRCLSGGIPPMFVAMDSGKQFLLIGLDGRALPYDRLREFIAEPITVQGELLERGDTQFLKINPEELQHETSL